MMSQEGKMAKDTHRIAPDPLSDESLDNVGMCELDGDCPTCGHLVCSRCPACLNGDVSVPPSEPRPPDRPPRA